MSRSRSLGLVVVVGLIWSLGVTPAAFAAKDSEKQAELKARQAFAASRYDEAIEIFAQLYAESLNPIYLRNIGRCHQKKREPEKAIDAFQDYLAKGKSITPTERKEIQGYIKDMEQLRDDQAKEREAAAKPFTPAPGPATNPNPATTRAGDRQRRARPEPQRGDDAAAAQRPGKSDAGGHARKPPAGR